MPRTREFEPEEALDKAMRLFWVKGYSDTSMDEVVKHTGVSLHGLYSAFGNKKELFLAALDRYRQVSAARLVAEMDRPGTGLREIREFFQMFVRAACEPSSKRGCLMCNTAVDMAPHDRSSRDKVGAHFDQMRKGFRRALDNAKECGEIRGELDTERVADYLTGASQGIFVLLRAGVGQAMVRNMVDVMMSDLE